MRKRVGLYWYLSEEEFKTPWESQPVGHVWFKASRGADGWMLFGTSDVYERDVRVRRFETLREAAEWLRDNYELAKRIAWPRIGDC
jgi:hypothetical protein